MNFRNVTLGLHNSMRAKGVPQISILRPGKSRIQPRLLLGVILLFAAESAAMASSKSRRQHGAEIYASNGCRHCHTIASVGGHKGPDLSGVGRTANKAEIRKQIVYGSKIMPAYGDMLSSAEVDDLVAYLRSCKAKAAPQPKESAPSPAEPASQSESGN